MLGGGLSVPCVVPAQITSGTINETSNVYQELTYC